MALRDLRVIFPVKKLIKKSQYKIAQGDFSSKTEEDFNKNVTGAYGGMGIQIIYDELDNVVGLLGDGLELKLFNNEDDPEILDHVEERHPGTDFTGVIRTSLDYLDNGNLDYVYSEILDIPPSPVIPVEGVNNDV